MDSGGPGLNAFGKAAMNPANRCMEMDFGKLALSKNARKVEIRNPIIDEQS